MVTMPTSTCDLPAFVLGFKDSYVLHWNQQVSTKIAQHSADMLKPSPEGAAQNSPSTYQALLIGASPAGGQTTFPNRCRSQSYVNGQAAGVKKAEVNFNLLPAQPTR
ncbi:hypothetical protein [uncultured Sphaerotilus sp.]|uniref:hypothetical protein n=1 Tax=uncultured Sphaerotilus sp. TaxID=474984 RepID=UPI0030CA323D